MKLPGAAWVALALGLTSFLSQWLQDYVSAPWVAGIVILLAAIAKLIETYVSSSIAGQSRGVASAVEPSVPRFWRVLFGS